MPLPYWFTIACGIYRFVALREAVLSPRAYVFRDTESMHNHVLYMAYLRPQGIYVYRASIYASTKGAHQIGFRTARANRRNVLAWVKLTSIPRYSLPGAFSGQPCD